MGRFLLDGPVPTLPAVAHDKDVEFCGPSSPDQELLVGKDGGIGNVVVTLVLKPGASKPPIHPSLEKPADKVELDNRKCLFEPHICVVRAGQTLVLKNSDAVGHNVNASGLIANAPFNDLLAACNSIEKKITKAEKLPALVQCSIHRWMTGYLVVRDDPYVAVSGTDGSFAIKNLPAGKWTLQAWQEKSGFVSQVKLQGASTEWKRGQFEVTIDSARPLDLGEIKVSTELFKD
jgi:plastocyanin